MQLRKCKRASEMIKNCKIVQNCLSGDKDLFREIKKSRKNDSNKATSIDGKTGHEIPNQFKTVYSDLYNRVDDKADLEIFPY